MKCFKHPRYKILRAPTADCWICRTLFAEKQAKNRSNTSKIKKKALSAIKQTKNKGKRKKQK